MKRRVDIELLGEAVERPVGRSSSCRTGSGAALSRRHCAPRGARASAAARSPPPGCRRARAARQDAPSPPRAAATPPPRLGRRRGLPPPREAGRGRLGIGPGASGGKPRAPRHRQNDHPRWGLAVLGWRRALDRRRRRAAPPARRRLPPLRAWRFSAAAFAASAAASARRARPRPPGRGPVASLPSPWHPPAGIRIRRPRPRPPPPSPPHAPRAPPLSARPRAPPPRPQAVCHGSVERPRRLLRRSDRPRASPPPRPPPSRGRAPRPPACLRALELAEALAPDAAPLAPYANAICARTSLRLLLPRRRFGMRRCDRRRRRLRRLRRCRLICRG